MTCANACLISEHITRRLSFSSPMATAMQALSVDGRSGDFVSALQDCFAAAVPDLNNRADPACQGGALRVLAEAMQRQGAAEGPCMQDQLRQRFGLEVRLSKVVAERKQLFC